MRRSPAYVQRLRWYRPVHVPAVLDTMSLGAAGRGLRARFGALWLGDGLVSVGYKANERGQRLGLARLYSQCLGLR